MRKVDKDIYPPPPGLKRCEGIYLSEKGRKKNIGKSRCYKNAKKDLHKLYHGKCAYCEKYEFYSIDHYRPRSIYPWLTLEWTNLVPSCAKCNTEKLDKFPLENESRRVVSGKIGTKECLSGSDTLKDEKPLLLHPEVDKPRDHLTFGWDGSVKEKDDSLRGLKTIEICELNRSELRHLRKAQLDEIRSDFVRLINWMIMHCEADKEKYLAMEEKYLALFGGVLEKFDNCCKPDKEVAFTLLGHYMHENCEELIVVHLSENEDIRNIARKILWLHKEKKEKKRKKITG